MATDDIAELVKQIQETNALARQQLERITLTGNTVQVIHEDRGPGRWQTAAIVACFATWFALILFAMEIHDLWAWKDIFSRNLSTLQAKQKGE